MGKKVKFNVSDIFMEGQNTVADRNLFVTSPLFGVFAALYNRSNGKIKVGKIETKMFYPSSGQVPFVERVYIVNKWGLQVCNIQNFSVDYNSIAFNVNHTALNSENYVSVAMQTSNPKYLQNKVSPSSIHDAASRFDASLRRADIFFNDVVRSTISRAIDTKFGNLPVDRDVFHVRRNLPDSTVLFLFKCFAGEVQPSEMKPADRRAFDSMLTKYKESLKKFKDALKEAYDMVSTDKWLYITNVNGGVILGAIRPEPMCAALDTLTDGDGNLPSEVEFNYVQETMPIKWYPSYDHIPEDVRQQLDFSIVMLKTHVGSGKVMFDDAGDYIFHELGSRYYSPGDSGSQFYFLTK